MSKVEKIIRNADQRCKTAGVRLTVKRKQVLAGLIKSEKALSAYDLVELCKQEFDAVIPAVSVYRILAFLEKQHLVHKLRLENKYIACSKIDSNHNHCVSQFLICRSCGKVKELNIKQSSIIDLQSITQVSGFKLISPQLEISCLCDDCFNETND